MSPLDLVGAAQWDHVAFTTYALSLSFFEAVVLDPLVRKQSQPALILADTDGVRSALAEHGARRVGRDYDLEPVELKGGVFHAKVSAFTAGGDAHLLVGSGNLTFGGWGANLECVEHLHPSFAGEAFGDAAEFFLALASEPRLTHGAGERLEALAFTLDRAGRTGRRGGDVRILHSLAGSIAQQIAGYCNELGGARRLTVAAPFWDDGAAVEVLAAAVGLDHVYVHAHPHGVVESGFASNWPRKARIGVRPVEIELLSEAKGTRRLHGKLIEIVCGGGRLIFSGSANASDAALVRSANVEAGVLRIMRHPHAGWSLRPASALPPAEAESDSEGAEPDRPAVLRARLEGAMVNGRVLGDFPAGPATAFQVSVEGPAELARVEVDGAGVFAFKAEQLEMDAWTGGRVVLRLETGGRSAEGFVGLADLQEVRRRAGPAAGAILALLANMGAPEDAQAVLGFFNDNPGLLKRSFRFGGGNGGERPRIEGTANIPALLQPQPIGRTELASGAKADSGWRRVVDGLLSAMFRARGPAQDPIAESDLEDEVEGKNNAAERQREARERRRVRERARAKAVLDRLFDRARSEFHADCSVAGLMALCQYVCRFLRIEDTKAAQYVVELVDLFLKSRHIEEREIAAASVVLAAAIEPDGRGAPRRARNRLLALGWAPDGPAPDMSPTEGFLELLRPGCEPSETWRAIASATTALEEILAFKRRLSGDSAAYDFQILTETPEWPELQAVLAARTPAAGVRFVRKDARTCPCSPGYALPQGELRRLAGSHLAKCPRGHILLCDEA